MCVCVGGWGRGGMAWIVEDLTLAPSSSTKLDRPFLEAKV